MYDDYDDCQESAYDNRTVSDLGRAQDRGWCCIGALVLSFFFPPAAPFLIGAAIVYAIVEQIMHGENPFW